jgi:hypothetical protein
MRRVLGPYNLSINQHTMVTVSRKTAIKRPKICSPI